MRAIEIYQSEAGTIEVRLEQQTLWLSQEQMAALFGVQKSAISKHLKNVYLSVELVRESTVSKMEIVQEEGGRRVKRAIDYFNLDAVISVGYRVNSSKATRFRQWATRILREHLTQGYTLSRQRFEANASELEKALKLIQKTAKRSPLSQEMSQGLIDIVTRYAQAFLWLQRYDEGLFTEPSQQPGGQLPSLAEARALLAGLKQELIKRGEATQLFAREREDGLAALLGNLNQSLFGEPAYPSIEAKAAHLLYFIVKNHPFVDGNKRSGAFLLVDFLQRNQRLLNSEAAPIINEIGLTALTLLVAESEAAQKETVIRLIMNMLSLEPRKAA